MNRNVVFSIICASALSVPVSDSRAMEPAVVDAALKQFKIEAAAGDANAQFNLGRMYEAGVGVPRNMAEAAKWFGLAADNGHDGAATAMLNAAQAPSQAPSQASAPAPAASGGLPQLQLPKLTLPGVKGATPSTGAETQTAVMIPPKTPPVEESPYGPPPDIDAILEEMIGLLDRVEENYRGSSLFQISQALKDAPQKYKDRLKSIANRVGDQETKLSTLVDLGEIEWPLAWFSQNRDRLREEDAYVPRASYGQLVKNLIDRGDLDRAGDLIDDAPYFRASHKNGDFQSNVFYFAAWAYAEQGQYEKAQALLDRADDLPTYGKGLLTVAKYERGEIPDILAHIKENDLGRDEIGGLAWMVLEKNDMATARDLIPLYLSMLKEPFASGDEDASVYSFYSLANAMLRMRDTKHFSTLADLCRTLADAVGPDSWKYDGAINCAMDYYTAAGNEQAAEAQFRRFTDEYDIEAGPAYRGLGLLRKRAFEDWFDTLNTVENSSYHFESAVQIVSEQGDLALGYLIAERISDPGSKINALAHIFKGLSRQQKG